MCSALAHSNLPDARTADGKLNVFCFVTEIMLVVPLREPEWQMGVVVQARTGCSYAVEVCMAALL